MDDKQISLMPIGGCGSVNPKYVTSIEREGNSTKLWVVGHMGYGTYSTTVRVGPAAARRYLNDPAGFMRKRRIKELRAVLESIRDAVSSDPKKDWKASLVDAADCLNHTVDELVAECVTD
jgi:hypothetical protein